MFCTKNKIKEYTPVIYIGTYIQDLEDIIQFIIVYLGILQRFQFKSDIGL